MYTDLRPFVRLFGEQLAAGAAGGRHRRAAVGGAAVSRLPAVGAGALAARLLGRRPLISTALWTALHAGYSAVGIVEVFLIGLFFSWLLWRTGSLRVAIFCHALYNSLIVLVLRYVPLPA